MTIKTALEQGTELLEDARVAVPRLTAEVLLAHALQRDRTWLYAHRDDDLTQLGWIHYGRYLHERLGGKPTQYITRRQEFYGREFRVSPAVLIPRPETEHVVETALRFIEPGMAVVDVGCGSGAIAVTLSLEKGTPLFATDISEDAVDMAAGNAVRLGACVRFVVADLLEVFGAGSLDVIVSNPPYVSLADGAVLQREVRDFEPHVALYGGARGDEMYERLIRAGERVLRPGGRVVFELGYRSLDPVRAMLGEMWADVESVADLQGYPRVLTARLRP